MKTFIRLDKLTLEDVETLYKKLGLPTIYHNGKAEYGVPEFVEE